MSYRAGRGPDEWDKWVYDEWQSHNNEYFGGELKECRITWRTIGVDAYGYYSHKRRIIKLSPWLTDTRTLTELTLLEGTLIHEYISDVLLHEMVHQRVAELGVDGRGSHNCRGWVDEINRLNTEMGLTGMATVHRSKNENQELLPGFMILWDQSHWPLQKANAIRNKVMHPVRGSYFSDEEFNRVWILRHDLAKEKWRLSNIR